MEHFFFIIRLGDPLHFGAPIDVRPVAGVSCYMTFFFFFSCVPLAFGECDGRRTGTFTIGRQYKTERILPTPPAPPAAVEY